MRHVAIIGAGPTGLYATQALTRSGCRVTLFNRDLRPGGLAEYGIFYTKHQMKSGLRKQFDSILNDPNVEYFGGVMVHQQGDVTPRDLASMGFDAVMVAVGAQGIKNPHLDNSFALRGVYDAKEIVYNYNGLPPWSEEPIQFGCRLVIIGAGNVAVDIAHWAVRQGIPDITFLVRRGPFQRAYSDQELQCIGGHIDRAALREELERMSLQLENIGTDSHNAFTDIVRNLGNRTIPGSQSRIRFRFATEGSSAIGASQQIVGLSVMDNALQLENHGVTCRPLREGGILECDTLVFAVGDVVDPDLGIPVDDWSEYRRKPNSVYELATRWNGWFVAGWARHASNGLIGVAQRDAEAAAQQVLDYLGDLKNQSEPMVNVREWLSGHGIRAMDWESFQHVRRIENNRSNALDGTYFRFTSDDDMWASINTRQ